VQRIVPGRLGRIALNATTTGRQTLHEPTRGFLEGVILSSDARDGLVLI
jgi:hypothetical protein